jgi:hypothetical protein
LIDRFILEYWIFAEALLERAAALFGVGALNAHAAHLGYPFGAALALSVLGLAAGVGLLRLGRPGWGLAGLLIGEELAALSLATAALAHGLRFDGVLVVARLACIAVAVVLLTATLRFRLSRETPPAEPKIPPAW